MIDVDIDVRLGFGLRNRFRFGSRSGFGPDQHAGRDVVFTGGGTGTCGLAPLSALPSAECGFGLGFGFNELELRLRFGFRCRLGLGFHWFF